MKEWIVTFPVVGEFSVTVFAEDEKSALNAAWEIPPEDGELQWEYVEYAVQGNVFYGPLSRVSFEELGDV